MEGKENNVSGNEPTTIAVVAPPIDNNPLAIVVVNADSGVGSSQTLERKKRGRPRKCPPDESLALVKRGRGRPPGSGSRQLLASLDGGSYLRSAGTNFTTHVMTVNPGEDVAGKIYSFSRATSLSVCILSANGSVSNVTIRQLGSSGGTLTYEGRFEILSLTGSFTLNQNEDEISRTVMVSVSLAGPNGRVIGGVVVGSLLAAGPIKVVVGSFQPNRRTVKRKHSLATAVPVTASGAAAGTTAATTPNSQTPTATVPAGDAENTTGRKPDSNAFQEATPDCRPSPDINISVRTE